MSDMPAPDAGSRLADYQKVNQVLDAARGLFLDTMAASTAIASRMLLVAF
jgi:hypothetical protein